MRSFAGMDRIVWPRAGRHRAVGAAVRERLAPGGPGQVLMVVVVQAPQLPARSRARTRNS